MGADTSTLILFAAVLATVPGVICTVWLLRDVYLDRRALRDARCSSAAGLDQNRRELRREWMRLVKHLLSCVGVGVALSVAPVGEGRDLARPLILVSIIVAVSWLLLLNSYDELRWRKRRRQGN